jgi:hypothetical protein
MYASKSSPHAKTNQAKTNKGTVATTTASTASGPEGERPSPSTLTSAQAREVHLQSDEIRSALVLFAEMCAAYEGWGLSADLGDRVELAAARWGVAPTKVMPRRKNRPDTTLFFVRAVLDLARIREAQRKDQRDNLNASFSEELQSLYEAFEAETVGKNRKLIQERREHLKAEIRRILLERYATVIEEGQLEELAPIGPEELRDRPKTGSAETAKQNMSDAGGMSSGSSGKQRREASPFKAARRSFDAWIPRPTLVAYLSEALSEQDTRAQYPLPFDCSKHLPEPMGLHLDWILERILSVVLNDYDALLQLLAPSDQVKLRAEVEREKQELASQSLARAWAGTCDDDCGAIVSSAREAVMARVRGSIGVPSSLHSERDLTTVAMPASALRVLLLHPSNQSQRRSWMTFQPNARKYRNGELAVQPAEVS